MAGKNKEEEYLDRLLHSVIEQDNMFGEDDITEENSIGEDAYQPELDNFDLPETIDDELPDEAEIYESDGDLLVGEEAEESGGDSFAGEEAEESDGDSFAGEEAEESDGDSFAGEEAEESEDDLFDDEEIYEPDKDLFDEPESYEPNFLDNLKDIVEKSSEEREISDAIEALNEESILTDEEPVDDIETGEDDASQGMIDQSMMNEFDDILALDDGISFDDIPQENEEEPLSEEDMLGILAMEAAHIDESQADDGMSLNEQYNNQHDISDVPSDISKTPKPKKVKAPKAKKEKKVKDKTKKKFSLKNFFLDYDEDEGSASDADMNQQLINELYQDGNSSEEQVSDNAGEASLKDKKQGKQKEKKAKKEKAPKKPKAPKKEKKTKEKTPKGKPDIGAIITAVVIAAVIIAIIIVLSNIFTYRNSISKARSEFELGHYEAANELLIGIDIKSRDDDLYMKVRTVMSIYQGISSYENYIELGMQPEALDALINAVGRKNKSEDLIQEYEVTSQVNSIYSQILALLDSYGISEKEALDYYNMTSLSNYRDILESYGGPVNDSNN